MRRERSCGVVVYRTRSGGGREFLLLHYPSGHWDFPKGHMEKGETEQETALRELREETGIQDVRLHEGFRHIVRYRFQGSGGRTVDKQVVFFTGRADADRLQISHEHQGYVWMPFDPALGRLTYDNAKRLLRRAERYLGSLNGSSEEKAKAR